MKNNFFSIKNFATHQKKLRTWINLVNWNILRTLSNKVDYLLKIVSASYSAKSFYGFCQHLFHTWKSYCIAKQWKWINLMSLPNKLFINDPRKMHWIFFNLLLVSIMTIWFRTFSNNGFVMVPSLCFMYRAIFQCLRFSVH